MQAYRCQVNCLKRGHLLEEETYEFCSTFHFSDLPAVETESDRIKYANIYAKLSQHSHHSDLPYISINIHNGVHTIRYVYQKLYNMNNNSFSNNGII